MANPIDKTDRLLTETEAASLLNLSIKTLRRWRWAGRGPRFLKLGAAVRYDPADLAAYIEAGRRTSTTNTGTPKSRNALA